MDIMNNIKLMHYVVLKMFIIINLFWKENKFHQIFIFNKILLIILGNRDYPLDFSSILETRFFLSLINSSSSG